MLWRGRAVREPSRRARTTARGEVAGRHRAFAPAVLFALSVSSRIGAGLSSWLARAGSRVNVVVRIAYPAALFVAMCSAGYLAASRAAGQFPCRWWSTVKSRGGAVSTGIALLHAAARRGHMKAKAVEYNDHICVKIVILPQNNYETNLTPTCAEP